jgi:DNA primase
MDFAKELKSQIDIARVIGEYVRLRRASPQRYQGLCPFHQEKTPSFSVFLNSQYFKCFGCGKSGDVLTFVQEIEGISFYEALRLLADRNGIPMPKRAEYSDPESKLRAALYQMHEIALDVFQKNLRSAVGTAAREYLSGRGVTPGQVEEFGIGVADPSGGALARRFEQEGFTPEQIEASGLARKREDGGFYDAFRGRLMFPIHNESGKIVGFAGRTLKDEEPKYLNSPATRIYQKSQVLYNLNRARNAIRAADCSILVEGYMDVIGVHSAGVRNVVASCGTALTKGQVRALRRHSDRIVVNFDPDAAGAHAAERSIQMLLDEGMHIRVLGLEDDLDPDEYVKKFGAEAYRRKAEGATNYFYWLADRARKRFDMRSAEGRMQVFKFLLPAIQRISDKLERLAVANDVAAHLGVEAGPVLEEFRKIAGERKPVEMRAPKTSVPASERILLQSLLFDAETCAAILPDLRRSPAVQRLVTRRIFEAVFAAAEADGGVEFARVEARLDENSKALLHEIAFADEMSSEGSRLDQAAACVRAIQEQDFESRRSELRAQVKAAERAGNFEAARRWMQQLSELERAARP